MVPAMASIIDTKLKFEAKPNLYQLAVYHSVYRALTSGDYDWVYLDTTHGINYMPHLASEAVRLAVHVYAVRRGRPIEYVTVNSDPYPQRERPTAKPQGQSEVPNLTIYETYHETATPQGAPGVVGALSLDILKWYVRTTSRNNRGELHVDEEALRLGLILGVSLRDALYPVMLSLGDEIGRYRDVVVSDLGRLDTAPVGVRRDGDWTVVAHTYEPSILRSSGGIMYRAAMAMHALLEVAHKLVEDVRGEVMVVNGSVALTIDALRRLNNAYGNITNRAIVENEIAKLQYVENDVNRDFMSKHVGSSTGS
ncbi:CRISPR-associated DxTHG motif protein [Vulcanisaeta sp. JCM 14467]|uniref:CRISPR-associated DxTHG motif protein n=1 Tax=Vulcanisaeta sp. JCM 14467 TaxID=1295370 RepID=UPI0020938D85|nr:CRISPR-associated DxTHG motif protein [Vulcanisaeta sp. JCM 14467]